jgi:hypothetical protein
MPKNDPAKTQALPGATDSGAAAATPEAQVAALPTLGSIVNVVVPEGVVLRNTETGALFVPGEATAVTVTVTILKRLEDKDLALAP